MNCVQIVAIQSEQRPAELASSMISLARAKQRAATARAAVAVQQERIQHDKAAVTKALAEAAKVGSCRRHLHLRALLASP